MTNIKFINKNNLLNNLAYVKKCNKQIIVMVKANAYGHDVKSVIKVLKNYVNCWGVANIKEALKIKNILKNQDCIFIASKITNFKAAVKNDFHITIDGLEELNKILIACKMLNKKAHIHIAINTGMNRIGVRGLKQFIKLLDYIDKNSDYLNLNGIYTHMFNADEKESLYKIQIERFKKYVKVVNGRNILIHIGGSYCLEHKIPKCINAIRMGFFIYGYGSKNLKPVMTIKTKIVKITKCKKGEYIGYGKTRLNKNTTIAQLPIGYADGVPRRLSGKGYVFLNNTKCKIMGNICMDCMFIDVSNINANLDDVVTVFNNAIAFAKQANTSPYEILTNFTNARAKIRIIN